MKSPGRLVFYIIVNIFVSALVTGTILYYYDHNYRKDCSPTLPVISDGTPSAGGSDVVIVSIPGAGAVADEMVVIQNNGGTAFELGGWMLKDSQNASYTFPAVTLYPGARMQVHTGNGTDTAADLYWGLSSPVWTSGELASLYDANNVARAFYRVP